MPVNSVQNRSRSSSSGTDTGSIVFTYDTPPPSQAPGLVFPALPPPPPPSALLLGPFDSPPTAAGNESLAGAWSVMVAVDAGSDGGGGGDGDGCTTALKRLICTIRVPGSAARECSARTVSWLHRSHLRLSSCCCYDHQTDTENV